MENNLSVFDLFYRDVMATSPSAVNAIVLLELKTVNTQPVRNDPKFRFWRTISVDWKRVFRSFRIHKHQSLGNFMSHKRQPLRL
jgi:hypothetical protein